MAFYQFKKSEEERERLDRQEVSRVRSEEFMRQISWKNTRQGCMSWLIRYAAALNLDMRKNREIPTVISTGDSGIKIGYETRGTLGASTIEKTLLRKILAAHVLTMGDIWDSETGRIEMELREQKERCYSEGLEQMYALNPYVVDGIAERIVREKRNGKPVYEKRVINYEINQSFMYEVTREYRFWVEENQGAAGPRSWYEHARDFFVYAKNRLDSFRPPLPCQVIVLTGGASRMPFIQELCAEIFGKVPLLEQNPSHSVSRGLCFLGCTDLNKVLPQSSRGIGVLNGPGPGGAEPDCG